MIRRNLGSHLVVECIHFSDYNSSVLWKKMTKEGMQIVAKNIGYADLIFKSILESDGGNYSCVVNGHEKRDILISVESKFICSCTYKISFTLPLTRMWKFTAPANVDLKLNV